MANLMTVKVEVTWVSLGNLPGICVHNVKERVAHL